ncbi:matrixin family metalloprotease [Nocardioides sp. SYSU DS0663]|uniref:matrixin family metalloprotease n=1 Tax=Nocardioides sp. SYSU DS0663 TaxID=3416445 RepID=UPI003F4BD141
MRSWFLVTTVAVPVLLSGCVVSEAPAPAPAPPGQDLSPDGQASNGDGYAFVHTRDNGEPVRWSTCDPIAYVVRPDGEPEGGRRLLEQSLERVSEATGLEFEDAGTTEEAPAQRRPLHQPDRYGDRWAPVLIAYSGPEEDSRLKGRAAGYGGPAYVSVSGGTPRYVSGSVVFDVEQMTSMGGDEAVGAVMLHELAHLVGLAHVDDRGQLMNPVLYGREVTDLQAGDLAGLEELGAGECYDPIEPRSIRGSG